MKKSALFSTLLFVFGFNATSQPIPPDSLYLGQIPPGNVRKLFSLAADPGYYVVEKIAISPDGKEIYYEETNSSWTSYKLKYYNYFNNKWNGPVDLFNGYYCLSLSPDGNLMYFENNNYNDCWISDKQGTAWNPPVRFLENFNVHSLNVTNPGNYYLSSNPAGGLGQRDICKLNVENSDTSLVTMGLPVNSGANEGDIFISNDESFMIFMSNRSGGYGSTDLYISYSKPDNTWTNPKNTGPSVNTSGDDFGPYVTTDNKYLFYESGYASSGSIYWVQIDQLIDSLRYTNFVPYVKNPIPDQTAITGEPFTFTIPDSTFVDDDGNQTLIYNAMLSNGNLLPDWLVFDSITATFTGIPPVAGNVEIIVTATDTAGGSASTTLRIDISLQIETVFKELPGIRIFPNPTSGIINIALNAFSGKTSSAEVSNPEGKIIHKSTFESFTLIDLTGKPKGLYILKLIIGKEVTVSKISIQ